MITSILRLPLQRTPLILHTGDRAFLQFTHGIIRNTFCSHRMPQSIVRHYTTRKINSDDVKPTNYNILKIALLCAIFFAILSSNGKGQVSADETKEILPGFQDWDIDSVTPLEDYEKLLDQLSDSQKPDFFKSWNPETLQQCIATIRSIPKKEADWWLGFEDRFLFELESVFKKTENKTQDIQELSPQSKDDLKSLGEIKNLLKLKLEKNQTWTEENEKTLYTLIYQYNSQYKSQHKFRRFLALEMLEAHDYLEPLFKEKLQWAYAHQLHRLFDEKSSRDPVTQIMGSVDLHPRAWVVEELVEAISAFDPSILADGYYAIRNPLTETRSRNSIDNQAFLVIAIFTESTYHAGPYYFQPMPYSVAHTIIGTEDSQKLEKVLDYSTRDFDNFDYGAEYPLPKLLVGNLEMKDIPERHQSKKIRDLALQYPGVFASPNLSVETKKKTFQDLLKGRLGGKTSDWVEALVHLHDQAPKIFEEQMISDDWRVEIRKTILAETGIGGSFTAVFSQNPLQRAAARAYKKLKETE